MVREWTKVKGSNYDNNHIIIIGRGQKLKRENCVKGVPKFKGSKNLRGPKFYHFLNPIKDHDFLSRYHKSKSHKSHSDEDLGSGSGNDPGSGFFDRLAEIQSNLKQFTDVSHLLLKTRNPKSNKKISKPKVCKVLYQTVLTILWEFCFLGTFYGGYPRNESLSCAFGYGRPLSFSLLVTLSVTI